MSKTPSTKKPAKKAAKKTVKKAAKKTSRKDIESVAVNNIGEAITVIADHIKKTTPKKPRLLSFAALDRLNYNELVNLGFTQHGSAKKGTVIMMPPTEYKKVAPNGVYTYKHR